MRTNILDSTVLVKFGWSWGDGSWKIPMWLWPCTRSDPFDYKDFKQASSNLETKISMKGSWDKWRMIFPNVKVPKTTPVCPMVLIQKSCHISQEPTKSTHHSTPDHSSNSGMAFLVSFSVSPARWRRILLRCCKNSSSSTRSMRKASAGQFDQSGLAACNLAQTKPPIHHRST